MFTYEDVLEAIQSYLDNESTLDELSSLVSETEWDVQISGSACIVLVARVESIINAYRNGESGLENFLEELSETISGTPA